MNRVKKSLPEEYRQKAQSSLFTAVLSAGIATLTCYPLDTVRRQMQMRGTPYKSIPEAFAGKLHIRARSSSVDLLVMYEKQKTFEF